MSDILEEANEAIRANKRADQIDAIVRKFESDIDRLAAELAKAREAGQVMFENSSYLVFMDTPQATEMHHALCKGRGMWAALATKAPELGGGAA